MKVKGAFIFKDLRKLEFDSVAEGDLFFTLSNHCTNGAKVCKKESIYFNFRT